MPRHQRPPLTASRSAALALALACLLPVASAADEPIEARFACEDGTELHAVFRDDEALLVLPDGAEVYLRLAPSGSGYAYEGPAGRLRGKGREAVWSAANAEPVTCREVSPGCPMPHPPGVPSPAPGRP